ncbi:hypothetical protein HMF8227_02664 [Saliniradius amylolyticus]|uniref:D-glutamate cyclase-like C-terminal domain-containing protein n=1 Tax=Saliniradius amylolyticus TaxID=2183582 RepID=A0A2S2E633_9ALTE|nr:glutamate cyclase domain-containing protein [Saliniradius amylolyticus]AWL13116.1 hypothetical protein HMF8227_02664 [Saliniradius amylolyticus]
MSEDNLGALSHRLEALLVQRNLRGMQQLQAQMRPGYLLRAARILAENVGTIIIGTGFPVTTTFETDGPVGAIALYQALQKVGYTPVLACGDPLFTAIQNDYRCLQLKVNQLDRARAETHAHLATLKPSVVLSIERPGLSADNRYTNMRGEDISERCACFDYFVLDAECPTIAIGDGGNEIGMGNQYDALRKLNIIPCATGCDELVVADVSNWAPYGILAMLGQLLARDLLEDITPKAILEYLSERGSVDGVTRENTLTEDSLCFSAGEALIADIRQTVATFQDQNSPN